MKLQKRLFVVLSAIILALVLVACGKKLTSIEIKGVEDIEVENDADFNVLTDVTAIGDDGIDYTDRITITSTSSQVNRETGKLDTSVPGEIKVRYEVRVEVGEDVVLSQPWRTITVLRPERGEELIQEGLAYWGKYENAGGTVDISEDQGGLKLDIVAGNETHEPRIEQMLIPFEMGKTYKISYEAKALEERVINVQSGELLTTAPWFVEFHGGQLVRPTITTDWKTHEYTFKHVIDNQNGGLIFEFGPIAGVKVDTTLWIRNIVIEETEEQEDLTAPVISGIDNSFVELNSAFDPLNGVTAMDNSDGDVTDKLEVAGIFLGEEEVDKVDTSVADVVYTIHYEVSDKAGNKAEEIRTITIKDFSADFGNILTNGDFKDGFNGWGNWADSGQDAAMSVEVVEGELVIKVENVGTNAWDAQVTQEGLRLDENGTYKLSFTARASVARQINVALGEPFDGEPYFVDRMPKIMDLDLTTVNQDFEYVFEFGGKSLTNAKFTIEVGNIGEAVPGDVIVSYVVLERALINPDFTAKGYVNDAGESIHGHAVENAGAVEHATGDATKDKLTVTVETVGDEAYIPHYYYITPKLLSGTYEFKLSITSNVTRTVRFNAILPLEDYTSMLEDGHYDIELKAGETYDLVIDVVLTEPKDHVKFELDFGKIDELVSIPGVFGLGNISLERK